MRKQEWINWWVDTFFKEYCWTDDRIRPFLLKKLHEVIDHPEFEPDKPVYSYFIDKAQYAERTLYSFSIKMDGVVIGDSWHMFKSFISAERVAKTMVEVLNDE
jgi:hypothetical protein